MMGGTSGTLEISKSPARLVDRAEAIAASVLFKSTGPGTAIQQSHGQRVMNRSCGGDRTSSRTVRAAPSAGEVKGDACRGQIDAFQGRAEFFGTATRLGGLGRPGPGPFPDDARTSAYPVLGAPTDFRCSAPRAP